MSKNITLFALLVVIILNLIIIAPVQILLNQLSSYNLQEETYSFTYNPSTPTPIEELYLNVDVGNINVQYTYIPVDFHMKVDVIFDLQGTNLGGKNYSYYFNMSWQIVNFTANFTLMLSSELWYDESIWIKKDVNILVTLKADIVVDIIANLGEGNFEFTAPFSTSVGNLFTNVSNGNIIYNFQYCLIEGNITANSKFGNLFINSYDVKYKQNNFWEIFLKDGTLYMNILQNIEMGANITGSAKLWSGDVYLEYEDNLLSTGALFSFPLSDWNLGMGQTYINFEPELFPILPNIGFQLKSLDYPASSNYYIEYNLTAFHFINVISK